MVAKLTRPAVAGQNLEPREPAPVVQTEAAHVVRPASWGQRPASQAPETQQERIQQEINPEANKNAESVPSRGGFGRRPQLDANNVQDEAPAPQETSNGVRTDGPVSEPRTRKARTPAPAAEPVRTNFDGVLAARVEVLKVAFADPTLELEEGTAIADELWKWVVKDQPF